MVFSSEVFLFLFLPVVYLLYLAIPNLKARNILLIVVSLVFYAWGEPVYVLLMVYSTVLDYVCGRGIGKAAEAGNTRRKKFFLGVSLVGNLGLLVVFKYLDDYVLSFYIFEHISEAVSLSYHREDAKEVHDLGYKLVVEHVCPCSEHSRIFVCLKHYECIHQCVAVIRSNYYTPVRRNVFLAFDLHFPIAVLYAPVNYRSEKII